MLTAFGSHFAYSGVCESGYKYGNLSSKVGGKVCFRAGKKVCPRKYKLTKNDGGIDDCLNKSNGKIQKVVCKKKFEKDLILDGYTNGLEKGWDPCWSYYRPKIKCPGGKKISTALVKGNSKNKYAAAGWTCLRKPYVTR